jgi:hypothetical protein
MHQLIKEECAKLVYLDYQVKFSATLDDSRFRITLQVNVYNVNISANIYPPLKQNAPLKSSWNNLSNVGSSAVITSHKPKQSYIYTHRLAKHSVRHIEKMLNIF